MSEGPRTRSSHSQGGSAMTPIDNTQDDSTRVRVGDKLERRVAFVTGGTRGIGAAI